MTPRRINPPHYFFAAIVSMLGLAWLPGSAVVAGSWRYGGAFVVIAGVLIAVTASRQFAAVGTNIVPLTRSSALVTRGAFALTRNPMYLGLLLALVGIAIVLNKPWPWLVPCVFMAILQFRFIRHEEVLMAQTFGEAYLQYKQRVRRWI